MSVSKVPWGILLSTTFSLGIFTASYVSPAWKLILPFFLIIFLTAFISWWRQRLFLMVMSLCLLFSLGGVVRLWLSWTPSADNQSHVYAYINQTVVLEAVVVQRPEAASWNRRYVVKSQKITVGGSQYQVKGLGLVQGPLFPAYEYGQLIRVEGKLAPPPEFGDFSYKDYLAKKGIHVYLQAKSITKIGDNKVWPVSQIAYQAADLLESQINQLYPEPHASLLAGLLIGSRRGFTDDFSQKLQMTGTTHIIAISGSNITFLIVLAKWLLESYLKRWQILLVLIFSVSFFVLLVGGGGSVMRAAVMGIMFVVATNLGRKAHIDTSLFLAAFLLLFYNPWFLWDISFQLSFLATASIVGLYLPLRRSVFYKSLLTGKTIEEKAGIWLSKLWQFLLETVTLTIIAQILVTPVIIQSFGQLSIISPLSNLLILWPIPFIMIIGFITIVVNLLIPFLSLPLMLISWLGLSYMILAIEITSKIPGAVWNISQANPFLIWGWYLSWGVVIMAHRKKEYWKRLKL